MAKLGSSSCRPLLQGMMLIALLLASIQADPVMAIDVNWQPVADLSELGEKLWDMVVKRAPDQALTELGKKPGWGDFSKGGKTALKAHRYLCKAQGWMDKQNPGGASGAPYFPVDIPGGELLPKIVPTFYSATSEGGGNSVFTCRFAPQVQAAGTTLVPASRYPTNYGRITAIRVQTPVYAAQP